MGVKGLTKKNHADQERFPNLISLISILETKPGAYKQALIIGVVIIGEGSKLKQKQ